MENQVYVGYVQVPKEQGPKEQHHYGRELLKQVLKTVYQLEINEQEIVCDQGGKPMLKLGRPWFNISHCQGLVVCAVSPSPVGVDAESPRRVTPALVRRVCCQMEVQYVMGDEQDVTREEAQRFLRLWTLKESYLKMTGTGIRSALDQVQFAIAPIKQEKENALPVQNQSSRSGQALAVQDESGWNGPVLAVQDESGRNEPIFPVWDGSSRCEWILPSQIWSNQAGNFWQIKLKEDYILSVCTKEETQKPILQEVFL